jgi:hypothetical protein
VRPGLPDRVTRRAFGARWWSGRGLPCCPSNQQLSRHAFPLRENSLADKPEPDPFSRSNAWVKDGRLEKNAPSCSEP